MIVTGIVAVLLQVITSSMVETSLASSPHPSVSGLVMTVCACVDFPRKTWEKWRFHRIRCVSRVSALLLNVIPAFPTS